jgi:hypothetical protein
MFRYLRELSHRSCGKGRRDKSGGRYTVKKREVVIGIDVAQNKHGGQLSLALLEFSMRKATPKQE